MSGDDSDGRIGLDAAIAHLISESDDEVNEGTEFPSKADQEVAEVLINLKERDLHKNEKRLVDRESSVSDSDTQAIKKQKTELTEENKYFNNDNSLSHGTVVAEHYNNLEEKGLNERLKSRIVYMRNFNNWIKSMLISEYLDKVKGSKTLGAPLRVLDIGCGKGGDLLKWQKGNITHIICADIAEVSVNQCETRYNDNICNNKRDNFAKKFTAEFITADCTRTRLREKYKDPSIELDLVSCQFAFHYCFETLPQAECMLRNAAECLREGGYFIGTIPDAYEIMRRRRAASADSFGNEVYNIEFQCDTSNVPLFGGKYMFQLEGVVDCPEFLVHFPTLVKLAKTFGLELVSKERFGELFDRRKEEGRYLLDKMQALETYPPYANTPLISQNEIDYEHSKKYLQNSKSSDKYKKIGTLSKAEWEAASIYITFAFKKIKTTWNAEGKPVYK